MTYHELLSDAQIFGCCGTVVGSMKIPRSERFPRNGPHAHRFLPEVSPRFLILWLVGGNDQCEDFKSRIMIDCLLRPLWPDIYYTCLMARGHVCEND
jgi:hypothetical protein